MGPMQHRSRYCGFPFPAYTHKPMQKLVGMVFSFLLSILGMKGIVACQNCSLSFKEIG